MAKGNRKSKRTKIKEKPLYELIRGILRCPKLSPQYYETIRQNFVNFVFEYKGSKFKDVYSVLLKNEGFQKITPLFNFDFSKTLNDIQFNDIEYMRLVELLITPLEVFCEEIKIFEKKRFQFEQLLVCGFDDDASILLNEIEEQFGSSVWLSKAKLLLVSQSENQDKLQDLIDSHKNLEAEGIFRILHTFASLFEIADPYLLLENTIIRDIREFIDGDASGLAAINILLYLPFPCSFNVHPFYSLWGLQQFNYIDLFVFIKEVLIQADVSERASIDTNFDELYKPKLIEVVSKIDSNWNTSSCNHNKQMCWYDECRYDKILDELESKNSIESISIKNINIYAKSYLYEEREVGENLPYILRTCIENLLNIYKIRDIQQSLSVLNSLSVNTLCFDISKHILISIEKALSYTSSPNKKLKLSLLGSYTAYGNTKASKYLPSALTNSLTDTSFSVREYAKRHYLNTPSRENFEKYLSYNPIDKDLIEVKAAMLLLHQQHEELLDYAVETLMDREEAYICFPMKQIAEFIKENSIETENSLIFFYFYSLIIDSDSTDSLHEVFEEFILSNDIDRPGEFFNKVERLSLRELFIFTEIATVGVMDYMGCFSGTTDLMFERIKILNSLKEDDRTDTERFEIEYQETLSEILIHEATAQLTSAKIFVDKGFIVKSNRGKLNTLANQFFEAKQLYEAKASEELDVKMNNALVDFYQLSMTEYLHNHEYGLDSNLSGDIRHTIFSNLMSSRPEDNYLLTELDVNENYKPNNYWLERYKIVNPKITKEVNNKLVKFSENFNNLIEQAESWMKVSTNDSKPERVFIFKEPQVEFQSLAHEFSLSASLNDLTSIVFESLEMQLSDCLKSMRDKINHDFAIALEDLFDDLLSDIESIKQSASLTDLVSAILNTKNSIKEDVKTASEWFHFRNNNNFASYPIADVIKIAERCFKLNTKLDKNIMFLNELEIKIEGAFVPKFIMAIINIFANAKKHMSNGQQIEVELFLLDKNGYKVVIYNSITKSHEHALLNGSLETAQEKLNSMNSNSLLSKEGGTGLYKSKYKLLTMSERFDLKIDVKSERFITEVSYNA
ncbi:MAG: hypothetical protein CL578_10655 [Alteromonadaceae bacterium]|uniref:hypothetical protein n=1 Tax=Paraglaciecola chathamensis TaxID=368405 RepID=UPI000C663C02|nr:hypothetical protein [Paraglaciecola agarilytica]MBN25495.1 hypothetical protein [Alteromonadaceae bacterium]|tara:strand:+ start:1453 stop:4683 length:3231 start_codon:yes stop_codon:yes gene_type:complete